MSAGDWDGVWMGGEVGMWGWTPRLEPRPRQRQSDCTYYYGWCSHVSLAHYFSRRLDTMMTDGCWQQPSTASLRYMVGSSQSAKGSTLYHLSSSRLPCNSSTISTSNLHHYKEHSPRPPTDSQPPCK